MDGDKRKVTWVISDQRGKADEAGDTDSDEVEVLVVCGLDAQVEGVTKHCEVYHPLKCHTEANILVWGSDKKQHDSAWEKVLRKLEQAGMTISVDKLKLMEAIEKAPSLGRFEHFSAKVHILRPLMKKGAKYEMSNEYQVAFDKVKNSIGNAGVLKPFDSTVVTDCSAYRLGAVFMQNPVAKINEVQFLKRLQIAVEELVKSMRCEYQ
ncbi:hypothetical protein NDU88_001695 [Pleurodeles waltl]|uniref:Reverse transcriptase/retrotransposon-derived protein RNase H-like domain-containing protein n=1 Tax=Pleurodeles waltl TaxID=8319 RepID=A0AAV7P4N6_PLEWA|nr:hypothetical protein NDU88_001695 [Pleurodeles waltl]